MRLRTFTFLLALLTLTFGCSGNSTGTKPLTNVRPATSYGSNAPSALPNNGYKAEITLIEPPTKLRAGEKATIRVRLKNASDVFWWARGGPVNSRPDNKFYIAVGNRWLKADNSLLTDMDGRHGIGKDLGPAEETEVPLSINAPKEAGEYTLEVDLIQEQVTWFHEKGSPMAKAKVTVMK